MELAEGGPRILAFALTLRIPAWVSPPTAEDYRNMYGALQSQLGLDQLQTLGTPPSCTMAKGSALQIQIVPAQGLFQCTRNLEAIDGGEKPRDVESMTGEFLVAVSEARKVLRPLLFVSPVAQLRAVWPVSNQDAIAFLSSRGGGQLHPERVGDGLVLGFHLIQAAPVQVTNPTELGTADLRVEPFVREPGSMWVEATFQYPAVAIAGRGVVPFGIAEEAPRDDVSKVRDCVAKARELLDSVPAFLGQEGA